MYFKSKDSSQILKCLTSKSKSKDLSQKLKCLTSKDTSQKLTYIFKCNYCRNEFTRKYNLERHLGSRCKYKKY